jgi:hypothetical protein
MSTDEVAEYERWQNETRETLNRRYDEAKAGNVQWIDGEEVRARLQKEHAQPAPLSKFRRFGHDGPDYIVTGEPKRSEKREWVVPIEVPETGEKLDYLYDRAAKDPESD